jgi:hypothetical protein
MYPITTAGGFLGGVAEGWVGYLVFDRVHRRSRVRVRVRVRVYPGARRSISPKNVVVYTMQARRSSPTGT